MTLPLERNPNTNQQNSISMSQVNVELFFDPTVLVSLNQVTVRNLLQKPDNLSKISLWDGFGKSNIGKPKNPTFTLITQSSATVSWGDSEGICNKYTVTVTDAKTDTIVYGTPQNFTTLPLATTANLTGLSSFPTISAAGTPTSTTFKTVVGFSVAFTYSTFGVALTADTWYRLSGNSNTLYNKVVQVISSADATHAVLFYPGTTPGAWGSGTTLIMKIETISAAGIPTAVAFNGSQILPYIISSSLPIAGTYNSTPGFSVDFTHSGTSLTANAWYRISGNTNLLYNIPVQVISVNGTTASVFYPTTPEVFGITTFSPTTILKVEKISAAGAPTSTTFNGVTGFSVEYTYSSIGAALITNAWYRIEGNSNPLYNANVQVISSADATHAVVFYPETTPGTWGTGTTTIMKVETFSSTGVPITINSIYGYSVAYTYSSLGAALTTGSWYRIENNSNTAYNKYVQVISSADATHATVFYAGTTALGTYGTGTTTIVNDAVSNNNVIVKTQPISAASTPTTVTYNSVAGYSVSYLYSTIGTVLSVNSWCRIAGNSNTAYNGYFQIISSADATHAVVFYPSNPGTWGTGTTTISTTANYIVHLLASNTAVTPLPTAETITELLTLEIIPLTPATPVITVISKNILRVTANASYASSYDIYEVISAVDTLITTNVQIPYDHTVVTYSTHTYKIKGRSTSGVGTISAASTATKSLPDFPIAATAVSYGALTNITSSTVAVTWTKSASPVIISQRVRVLLQADGVEKYNSGLLGNTTVGNTSTSVLVANTVYNVYVDTNNEAGTAVSAVLSFTTKTVQPAAPSAGATSQTSITVTWGTTVGATSYVIYKDGASVGTKTSPFIDNTGITAYTAHSYQVAAVNAGGESVKSGTATETSWPEVPVNVTGVILTPDMNSISISWTKAVTTPTRTVDNYRVYAYLTSDMSQVFDSGLLANSIISTVTNTNLIGWTGYTIRIYTYNKAGNIYVDNTITTLPDLKPDPITSAFVSVTNQEPNATAVAGSSVTIGTFTPGYSTGGGVIVSASNGSFQTGTLSLTTGWVTTATVIPDSSGNIVFQPRMNASPNETNTVTSTFTIGAGSRTFSVTTRDPNPPSNPSAVGGTGIATISWTYNSLYTYTVTADTGQTKTGITSGSVVLGDLSANNSRLSGTRTFSIYAKNVYNGISSAATPSAYVTPMPLFTYTRSGATVTETAGSNTGSFGISTTNVATNTSYNWSITGVSAADFSAMSYTSTGGTVVSMTPALTGSFIVNSGVATVSFTIATDHLTESTPETMSFQLTGSPTGDFATSNTTMSITDTSLNPNLTPEAWSPDMFYNHPLGTNANTTHVMRGLEPNWPISISASNGLVFADGMAVYAASGTATTNSLGEFVLGIKLTASGSYKTDTTMSFTVGTYTGLWTVRSEVNEVISVTAGTRTITDGASITYTVSGANNNDWHMVDVVDATGGTIVNATSVRTSALSATGTATITLTLVGYGTYRLRATFNSSGHTRYSETVTQNADTTPATFAFPTVTSVTNVQPGTTNHGANENNIMTVSGMSALANIPITYSFSPALPVGSPYSDALFYIKADGTHDNTFPVPATTLDNGTLRIAVNMISSFSLSQTRTLSLTIGGVTVNPAFSVTTRAPVLTVSERLPSDFPANVTNQDTGQVITVLGAVYGLEPNYTVTLTASGGFIAGSNTDATGLGTYSTSVSIVVSAMGRLIIGLQQTTSGSFRTTTSMSYSIANTTGTWSATTTANEQFTVSPSSMSVGATATLNITGAIANSTVTLQTVNSNGNITDVVFLSGLLVNSNGSASTGYMVGARGTCQFRATFSATGHTRTTGTLTVYPIPAVSISFNITTREMAVSITNAWPTDTFNIVGTGTGNMSGLNLPAFMTIGSNGTSTAYYMGTSNAVWGTWWGTWYCTVTSSLSAYTATSNTVTVPKLAPNVTPAIGTVTAQNGSISFPYTLGASTAGPVEFVASVMNGGTPSSNANISSDTFTYIGLTNGTQYLFSVYAGNSTANGSASVFSATPVLTAPVVTVTLSYIASGLGFIDFGFTVGTNTGGPWSSYSIWTTPNPGNLTTTWISASPPYSGRLSGTINWGTQYSIYIAVSNAAGYSASSNTITVTPTPDTTPNSVSLTINSGYSTSPNPGTLTKASGIISGMSYEAPVTISWSVSGFTSAELRSTSPYLITGIPTSNFIVHTSTTGSFSFEFSATTSSIWGGANTLSFTVGTLTNPSAFSITNRAADTTPNAFSFTGVYNATRGSYYQSNVVTLAGMDAGALTSVSATGGTLFYSTDGVTFNYANSVGTSGNSPSTSANISTNNIHVKASVFASGNYSTPAVVSINYGGTAATYTVTTIAPPDTTPNAFSFADSTGLEILALASTNTQFIYGMDNRVDVPVSITNGTLYYLPVDSGTMVPYSGSGTLETDNFGNLTIAINASAPTTYLTTKTVTLTVGGVSGTWKVITKNAVPGAPGTPSITSITTSGCRVSWTAPTTGGLATAYDLAIIFAGPNGPVIAKNQPGLTDTFYDITGLTSGNSYTAQVTAKNSVGTGGQSSNVFTVASPTFVPVSTTGAINTVGSSWSYSFLAIVNRSTVFECWGSGDGSMPSGKVDTILSITDGAGGSWSNDDGSTTYARGSKLTITTVAGRTYSCTVTAYTAASLPYTKTGTIAFTIS